MIERHNISYGSMEPAETIYETDHVIKNYDVRKVEHTEPDTGVITYEWVAGTAQFYEYKEYAELQDAALERVREEAAENQAINDELLLDLDTRVAALEE